MIKKITIYIDSRNLKIIDRARKLDKRSRTKFLEFAGIERSFTVFESEKRTERLIK